MRRDRRAAFTLIELLVVIAVIAIIAAILFPVFARVREKARQATCLSGQKQIAAAVLMYMGDYDETFPFVLDWSANIKPPHANQGDNGSYPLVRGATGQEPQFQLVTVVAPYVRNSNIWYCPSVGPDYVYEDPVKGGAWNPGATMRDQGTSYFYNYLCGPYVGNGATFMGGKSYSILREPSRWPMLCDEPEGSVLTKINVLDPPSSALPHSGGVNVAYGDGHAKFHRSEVVDANYLAVHGGDGLYPGQ